MMNFFGITILRLMIAEQRNSLISVNQHLFASCAHVRLLDCKHLEIFKPKNSIMEILHWCFLPVKRVLCFTMSNQIEMVGKIAQANLATSVRLSYDDFLFKILCINLQVHWPYCCSKEVLSKNGYSGSHSELHFKLHFRLLVENKWWLVMPNDWIPMKSTRSKRFDRPLLHRLH